MPDFKSITGNRRTMQFLIRLTKHEMNSLDKKVQSTGMSREGYIRNLLNGYAPICVPPMDYFILIKELRAIGNNMQQIAQRANSMKFIDAPYYRKNVDRVLETCDYIFSLHLPAKVGDIDGYNKNLGGT